MKNSLLFKLPCLKAALSFILLFSVACDKEETASPIPIEEEKVTCNLVKREWSNSSGSSSTITVEYDDSGRFKASTTTFANGAVSHAVYLRDSEGRVIRVEYRSGSEPEVVASNDIDYDAQGRWIRATQMYGNKTEVEYDSQDRIVKSTYTSHAAGNTFQGVRTFEYTEGNMTRMTVTQDGGAAHVLEFEHILDKPAPDGEYNRLSSFLSGGGSLNKNLVRKLTTTITGAGYTTESDYSYEFNKEGYPTLMTVHSVASEGVSPRESTSVTKMSYSCE